MAKKLWQPSEDRIRNSNIYRFMKVINKEHALELADYDELYQWSVMNIPEFWSAMWNFADIQASRPYMRVVDDPFRMPGAVWFEGAKLNFAENLLRCRDDRMALIFRGEDRHYRRLTYRELYDEVARVAHSLRELNIGPGDRIAGFMPNMPEAIIAMLAAASIGATWSSCSPDFGIKGVLDRFGQIRPRVLFTADGYAFKGKTFDSLERIKEILQELPSIEKVIVTPYINISPDIGMLPKAVTYGEFKSGKEGLDIAFEQLPAGHPLYIMFTSGTTGLPKCMVQSAGGILINQMKELMLHADLKRDDTIFYFTTCGWMMWNWLVCSLAVGSSIVLYEGNPFYPHPGALWEMAQDESISIFGTSAGYLNALQNSDITPGKTYDLSSLKSVLSTGSPLSMEGFEYVYREIKDDLQLASISGGSDINGCFAGGNPMGPVYAGELQCRCLGMKVEAWDENSMPVINRQGELVCTAASPSMPLYFWDDPDGSKYHSAYFDVYPGVWRHGDYIEINERGGVVIYGRSDATLNPGGVRIGTAEIYRQVESVEDVEDSLVIGQEWKGDVRVILFVKMAEGFNFTKNLAGRLKKLIRENASPRHVPAKILPVPDVPYTLNMKKVELAVKKTVEGKPVLNKDALRNPEVLDYYAGIRELQEN